MKTGPTKACATKARAMKNWQPHVDLHKLSIALSEEIIAAPKQELHRLHAESGYSIAAAAQDVRALIASASGEPDAGHFECWGTAVAHVYAS
jgi:hypothetical protein